MPERVPMRRNRPKREARVQSAKPVGMGAEYYNGAHYKKGQPFATYLNSIWGVERAAKLRGLLQQFVRNSKRKIALEIGPGNRPLISRIPFKKRVYLDISHVNALQAIKAGKKNEFSVVGDVRQFPFQGHFGAIVANEVFTHVQPSSRAHVLTTMIEHGDHLFILDRPLLSIEQLRDFYREQYGLLRVPAITDLHRVRASLVDFDDLARRLEKKGFLVMQMPLEKDVWGYHVLVAKRVKK